ncbi:hypothetical protein QJS10_CPB04g00813 [Acorus calamus]|uniref:Reverse transcriptase zinc-binding domain-containing protein n=1 Tax=Acorus calamus TaxID=4465 RepID=A0AAV9F2A5_ACOCL|nr:hypothetical protein QJS10_CPB04g00813 [Acorus calamus]
MGRAIVWNLGNGASVNFWQDRWSGVDNLRELAPDIYQLAVRKNFHSGGVLSIGVGVLDNSWVLELLQGRLNAGETCQFTELLGRLGQFRPQGDVEDLCRWRHATSGKHSVKSAYNKWSRGQTWNSRTYAKFAQTWSPKILLKIKVFMWFLFLERLPTKVYRSRWAPEDSTDYALCVTDTETIDHLFCMCEVVQDFWAVVGRYTGMHTSFQTVEEMWATGKVMKRSGDQSREAVVSQLIVPAGAWTIWKTRNDVIFNGSRVYQENMWDMF